MLSSGAFTHQLSADIHEGASSARRAGLPSSGVIDALVGELAECETPDALRSWLGRFAEGHVFRGGRYVHFGHVHPGRWTTNWKPLRFLSTCDDGANLWLTPNVDTASVLVTFLPFAWSMRDSEISTDNQRAWIQEQGLENLPGGITVPVQDHVSGPACLILFGGSEADAVNLVETKAPSLIVTALAFHLLAKVLIPSGNIFSGILSDREIACLRLVASGETLVKTANTLGVSIRTVELYVGRATKKLSAMNKVHAVAIAVGAGLLQV